MSAATHSMRRLWLIMLHQRGWWTLEQINHELRKHHPDLPTVDASVLDTLVAENRMLSRMWTSGKTTSKTTYAVEASNLALRTVTLGDLGLFND
jgi:hypothetical protein